jgi:hypothetical protein
LTRAEPGGARTLRELSLKYYGEAQHWPLIAWVNRDVLGGNVSGSTSLPDSDLWVLRLRP